MESFLVQLGTIIKQARIKEGLTQAQLAEKADISTRYLMDIENKNDIPSLKVFIALFRALRLSVDLFLYPDSKETDQLHRILSQCNDKQITIITAMTKTMLDVIFNYIISKAKLQFLTFLMSFSCFYVRLLINFL